MIAVTKGGTIGPGEIPAPKHACCVRKPIVALVVLGGIVGACAGGADLPFELRVEPDFVQGVIPGEELIVPVSIEDIAGSGGEVNLAVNATGGRASVNPRLIKAGEVAEVMYIAESGTGTEEVPMTLTITATRGSQEQTHEISTVVVPWEDTLAATANEIFAIFRPWLAENRPELGIDNQTQFEGTLVAPYLLEVSHYAFFNQDWEVGLAWHIMTAPHDWAQLYLRPRGEMAPIEAFQLNSWSTARSGDPFEIGEVAPPNQVVR
jgi:hypothetical protein